MDEKPMLAKSLTTGVILIGGDIIAQNLERYGDKEKRQQPWDFARTARMGGFGTFFLGPMLTVWYAFMTSAISLFTTQVWWTSARFPTGNDKAHHCEDGSRSGHLCTHRDAFLFWWAWCIGGPHKGRGIMLSWTRIYTFKITDKVKTAMWPSLKACD